MRMTISEVISGIRQRYGAEIPVWKLRRVLDAMEASRAITIQRVGNYRTVSGDDVPAIAAELQRIGWLKSAAVPC